MKIQATLLLLLPNLLAQPILPQKLEKRTVGQLLNTIVRSSDNLISTTARNADTANVIPSGSMRSINSADDATVMSVASDSRINAPEWRLGGRTTETGAQGLVRRPRSLPPGFPRARAPAPRVARNGPAGHYPEADDFGTFQPFAPLRPKD